MVLLAKKSLVNAETTVFTRDFYDIIFTEEVLRAVAVFSKWGGSNGLFFRKEYSP